MVSILSQFQVLKKHEITNSEQAAQGNHVWDNTSHPASRLLRPASPAAGAKPEGNEQKQTQRPADPNHPEQQRRRSRTATGLYLEVSKYANHTYIYFGAEKR